MSKYRTDIDALKGLAIFTVVLFHCGLLATGYLGVDLFFVINGFLILPALCKKIANHEFSLFEFYRKRIIRLSPLIVIASTVCMCIGYFVMLPDAYENMSESVVASNLMAENILEAITTKNYWDVVNDYKPLMHLWYIGILFQFYIIMPLLLMGLRGLAKKVNRNPLNIMIATICVLAIISLILYLSPIGTKGDKFYFLQFRLFELLAGGLIGLKISKLKWGGVWILLLLLTICFALFDGSPVGPNVIVVGAPTGQMPLSATYNYVLLILTVLFSCLTVGAGVNSNLLCNPILSYLGKRSYSIFIWHQVILAFYRYTVSDDTISLMFVLPFFVVVIMLAELTYRVIEKGLQNTLRNLWITICGALIVICGAFYVYTHAGVVRNIPELDVVKGEERRGMFGEYCDRVYRYDHDFAGSGNKKVLVVGNSFARDFGNILLESKYADNMDLSYAFSWTDGDSLDICRRIQQSDIIFVFGRKSHIPDWVLSNIQPQTKLFGIGTKTYGNSNGIIYAHRNSPDYFNQSAQLSDKCIQTNEFWKADWGSENYVDMIAPALTGDHLIRVFTSDNRYISQDCRHLTKGGAQWYAKVLDLEHFLNAESTQCDK